MATELQIEKAEKTSFKSTIQIENTTIKRLKDFCDSYNLTKDEMLNFFMNQHEPEMITRFKARVASLEGKTSKKI